MHALALVMIVRDEARCLGRCLASARAHVDEIVVLDTGSQDETPRIAREAGARVEHFDWVDDFAAARNRALELTDAPWRLVLDADEWIDRGAESLRVLRDADPAFVGLVTVSSAIDAGGTTEQAPSWLPRLLPRGVRYEGCIHEQPTAGLPRRRVSLVIGHDGYLPAPMAAKRGRNETLLRRALAAAPGDAYLSYQLGKDLAIAGRHAQALPAFDTALAGVAARASWRHDLVLRRLFSLKALGRFDLAIPFAQAEMPRWGASPDFWFTVGDVLLDWALAEPARGAELLPLIEQSWQRALAIGEQPELPDSVAGRGSFLAAGNLAAFHESLGHASEAAHWRAQAQRLRRAHAAN